MTILEPVLAIIALWCFCAPKSTGEHIAEIVHAYLRKRAELSATEKESK